MSMAPIQRPDEHGLFVVGIGSSAGGIPALIELLKNASCHKSMCFVIVSHVPRYTQNNLVEILHHASNLKTVEITGKTPVEHCKLYVIPPNKYVQIFNSNLELIDRPTDKPNQSANVFFKSLAKEYGSNAVGVVLSGARVGLDGAQGIREIRASGGHTYAQEPQTALFSDMPELSIATGCVDSVLSPAMIGHELSLINWALPSLDLF